ncbi:MAG: metallophosphoesterase [Acidobacteriota bacterium]|nr:metallophosphoesterase [Acidobacteriota bacterium]
MKGTPRRFLFAVPAMAALLAAITAAGDAANQDSFRFVILGDRTGEAQPGVYERAWKNLAAANPAFVVSVGDSIQGLKEETAEAEWQDLKRILRPFRRFPLYLAPGNHDIWSDKSQALFEKYAGHPPHYSFDYRQAHFTILDNSRSEQFSPEEMKFLQADLESHAGQPLKFIVSHRPSWLMETLFNNTDFPLHQLAKKYGVQYVFAGHVHEMLHAQLQGVTYLSMPSAGGHLRASKKYEDGWFFGYTVANVRGNDVNLEIKELRPPFGEGHVTAPSDWGKIGLREKVNAPKAATMEILR